MAAEFRVLLIEDSDEDADLVIRFVRKFSAKTYHERVQTEPELRQALQNSKWDIILSDYRLPKFSGPEAIRILKESKCEIPLILVSGTIGEETAVEVVKMGATDYVLKTNLGRLATSIEQALRGKKAEIENRKLMKQLEQAQKMEAIGRLAGGIAHDVNNALGAITLYAEMALEQIESPHPTDARPCLEGILAAQESAAGIVRQLLSFSRKNFEPAKVVDFSAVVKGVQPLIKTLLGGTTELKIQISTDSLKVLADPTQIEQIVMNLAVNARDAMPTGGTFSLSLHSWQMDSPPPEARIPVVPGRYVCLSARDTGCGMSEEVLERIFEPFYTTKDVGKGTGLGLSVIFGIINQAKGTLLVESELNHGTEFHVLWPISDASEVISKIEPNAQSVPRINGSATILLVEDEESLRHPLAATLRKQGYTVIEASDGLAALKVVSDQKVAVSLLISDMIMPGLAGPEVAKKLREKIPNLGVLFLSGYADDSMDEYRVDTTSTWFLQKPFTTRSFIEKVADILSRDNQQPRKDS